ncbi:MAG TPA: ABC transporter ATP-binding protein [Acidimicrobiales bacterium]|nr:ABC transporter ATP-binding protein [Acidimicrobiales bacterium]
MDNILAGRPDPDEVDSRLPLAVRFDGVHYRYGRHVALDGLELRVPAGQTVALLGPNGAGKSTTLSLLLGLLRPQTGTVEVLGRAPRSAVRQGRVGAMLQTGSGAGLPPQVRVGAALQLVRSLYPHPAPFELIVERAGIGALLDRPAARLSGGQAQSVRFAIAIAGDPDLVFMDEPTAAMDIVGQRAFWRMIREFAREGRTTVFATHHLHEADQVADRVVVVNHGRVVADGPGASLKAAVAAKQLRFRCRCPDPALLDQLEGVTEVDVHGDAVSIASLDADATVRALVAHRVEFTDIEVSAVGLAEAFVALTETDRLAGGGAPQ